MKILCTPDCPLSPVAVAVVPGFCDVGPHVNAVPNCDAVPHSDVASHDDVAQENLSGLSFMTVVYLNLYHGSWRHATNANVLAAIYR